MEPAPARLVVYEVSFVTTRRDSGTYIVRYVIDPATNHGYVYLPGKRDSEYWSNTWLIYRGGGREVVSCVERMGKARASADRESASFALTRLLFTLKCDPFDIRADERAKRRDGASHHNRGRSGL